jgi:hypothetical protein
MCPTFSGGGFAIDVVNADSREELIQVFAEYRVVPEKNPMAGSSVSKSDYILKRRGGKVGGNKHAVGTETRKSLIQKLGINSDAECERVREEIKNHPHWGNKK